MKAVEAHIISDPKEGQGRSFSWQGHGLCFLGFPGCHTDQISSEGPHSDWTALFWTTETPTGSNQRKKARNAHKRNPLPSRQCPNPHLSGCHGNNSRLWIRTCSSSTLFARPGPLQLPSFPQNEKSLGWSPFCQ